MVQLLDVALLAFIAVFAYLGLRSGLLHESVTLFGLALGLFVGGRFAERLGPLFMPWLGSRGMANLAAFLLILSATWALTIVAGSLLRSLLQGLRLGWLDNLGGALLGILKGLFLVQVVVLVFMVLPGGGFRDAVLRSALASRLARLAPDLLDLVPPVLRYWKPF